MPDITMCEGGSCPKKNECYLYRALPSPQMQSYMMPPYLEMKVRGKSEKYFECVSFVHIQSHHRVKDLEREDDATN